MTVKIYCCGCQRDVVARLTNGREIYPHRVDLHKRPFWKCDRCLNYVGCHYKTTNPTNPLGNIATAEIRKMRQQIHAIIDPEWQSGKLTRGEVYRRLANALNLNGAFHTSEINSVEQAESTLKAAMEIF